jgi:hypothetical protein
MALEPNQISKKARNILDQIVKEKGANKAPEKLKLPQKNKQKKDSLNFDTSLYKNLVVGDKKYLWIIISIALTIITLIMIFRVITSNLLESEITNTYQPEIPKLEKSLKNLSENIVVKNKQKNEAFENIRKSLMPFMSEEKTTNIVDDITRLFEVGNILILKQEVNFSGNPYTATENLLDTTKPSEELTAFSEVKQESIVTTSSKKESRNKTNNNQINSATRKNKYTIEANESSKISLGMNNNIPSELAFLNMKLMLKGSYVNYVKARNAFTRVIPSANIVLEEVVITKAKKDVEIRIVIDIPYKKY